jgi:hypothetical protein
MLAWRGWALAAAVALLLAAGPSSAQLPMGSSTQFDLTGFLQEATLDGSCTANAHCGGTLKVNGHVVVVPKETIVILPANALTWQELFTQAPAPYAGGATGMALADVPAPLSTYEVHVVGNRVLGGPAGADLYIAGLVNISQQGLNSGAGFINSIDYSVGELRVGGVLNDPTTGARVRLNDPAVPGGTTGRYGRANTPDPRFMVDQENPTIQSATGFPMCLPRVAPGAAGGAETDPLCPQGNRPAGATIIQTNDPGALPGVFPDATKQVPFEVGDYVTFAGTLVSDNTTAPTAGPWPGTGSTYVSAHTITDNVAVYTWPGTNPAYVAIEVSLIGTGGLTVIGAGEAAVRTRFEGMTTDPSRNVHLYGIDINPLTGATTDRDWGTIGVDPGAPTGAVKGRWRFRPPCTVTVATQKACTPPPNNTFLPPTREVRAVIEGAWTPPVAPATSPTAANGLTWGQYHAPIAEYIFPENIPGTPIPPNNFNTIGFLAQGGYVSSAGTLVGQLNPWPDSTIPTPACIAAVAQSGGPYTAASGGTILLAGSGTGTPPLTFAWATPAQGSLSSTAIASPVYTAPPAPGAVALSLTVSNACGTSTSNTTVTVNAAAAPTVNHVAPTSVFSGATGSFAVSGVDPGGTALTFNVVQAGAPALLNLTVTSTSPTTATVAFRAPTLPVGQPAAVVNLTITATNAGATSSAPEFTTVTVNPLADAVALTTAEYRTSKQRLDLTATSSVVSPGVVLTLQPYVTATGTTFDPTALGSVLTNNGNGLYTLTLVGAPEPALPPARPLVVKSSLGGASPPTGLTRIRN